MPDKAEAGIIEVSKQHRMNSKQSDGKMIENCAVNSLSGDPSNFILSCKCYVKLSLINKSYSMQI